MEMLKNTLTSVFPPLLLLLLHLLCGAASSSGSSYSYEAHPRFICTPVPADADPSCFSTAGPGGSSHQSAPPAGWRGASEEAKATILHLRESLVQQRETILDQRETIRELTAKLALCEGFGRGATPHDHHHGSELNSHHAEGGDHHLYTDHRHQGNQQGHHRSNNFIPDSPHQQSSGGPPSDHDSSNQGKDKHVTVGGATSSPQQLERMLQALKERLENLQRRNTSTSFSSSLKELLQRKVNSLEQQLHHHSDHADPHDGAGHHDEQHPDDHSGTAHHNTDDQSDHHDDGHNSDHHDADDGHYHHDDDDYDGHHLHHHSNQAESHSYPSHTSYRDTVPGLHSNKLDKVLDQLHLSVSSHKGSRSHDSFQISFPIRTNYMYGQVKRTLLQEIFAFTLCLWMKTEKDQSLGTPFSYSAPGQANELVLIEWGDNPLELLVDDKAVTLPLSLSDGQRHHVCVTWSTRDGQWEAYQDGVQRGAGNNLSPWRPIKPGGVFILGQEQDILGGRFDATQSFVGEMSDVHMWSHVLSGTDIHSLASCGSYLRGDVIAWSDTEVELHGGLAKLPSDHCH